MDSKVFYKDYFSEEEAAEYCNVSYRHFRKHKAEAGIKAGSFMGRLVYRRTDLQRAIEREAFKPWQPVISITGRGTSNGGKTGRGKRSGLVGLPSSPSEKPN